MNFYVYIFLDPRKPGKFEYDGLDICFLYEPFYVGKGTRGRMNAHLSPLNLKKTDYKSNKLRKIISSGFNPIKYKLYENISNDTAIQIEIDIVSKIGRFDKNKGPLLNMTDAGEGMSGNISKLRKRITQTKLDGTIIIHESIIACAVYNNMAQEHVIRICKGIRSGKKSGMFFRYTDNTKYYAKNDYLLTRDDPRKKKIYQLDIYGNIIKEYKSAADAAKVFNTKPGNINHSCKSINTISNGFKWSYVNNYNKLNYNVSETISQYSICGLHIKDWIDVPNIIKELGGNRVSIYHCLKGRNKTSLGYIWKYKNNI